MTKISGFKNNAVVSISLQKSRHVTKRKVNARLGADRVVGWDTESFPNNGKLTTVSIQVDGLEHREYIDVASDPQPGIRLIDYLFSHYAVHYEWDKDNKERPMDKRDTADGGRPGRREATTPVLLVAYNAEYDMGRLFGFSKEFMRSICAGSCSAYIQIGKYEIEIVRQHLTGSAPHFEWYVRDRDQHQIVRVIGRDLWGYWKFGLDNSAIDCGLIGKIAIDKADFQRDWTSFSQAERENIQLYAMQDAKITRQLYEATADMLGNINPIVFNRAGVLPVSAPGASARIMFDSYANDEWDMPPTWIEQLGAAAYCGGNVMNTRTCYAKNVRVIDISSSYPYSMMILPDPSRAQFDIIPEQDFKLSDFAGKFGIVCVSGHESSSQYPSLRHHDEKTGRLCGVYGDFEHVFTTIPEIVFGVVSERLTNVRIHFGGMISDTGSLKTSGLFKFMSTMYKGKTNAKDDKALRNLFKIIMNSMYGKFVECNANACSLDTASKAIQFPLYEYESGEGKTRRCISTYDLYADIQKAYIESGIAGIFELADQKFEEHADHIKLDEDGFKAVVTVGDILSRCEAIYQAGISYMPCYAALITGIASAKVALMGYLTNAIQMDTDSAMFSEDEIDLDSAMASYDAYYKMAGYLRFRDTGIGEWESEIEGASGYFIRNKMYAMVDKKGYIKEAHHGMSHVDSIGSTSKKEAVFQLIKTLYEKGCCSYTTKKHPLRLLKAAAIGEEPGVFFQDERHIRTAPNPCQHEDESGEKHWNEFTGTTFEAKIFSNMKKLNHAYRIE